MKRQLPLMTELNNEAALPNERSPSSGMGAVLCFLGFVRETEGNDNIRALEYEVFQRMAEHQINLLFEEIAKRWPIESVRLVHRVGVVNVNQPSLWVEVVAPHRSEEHTS